MVFFCFEVCITPQVPPEAPSNPISENIAKGFFSAIQFQLDDPSFDPLETNDNVGGSVSDGREEAIFYLVEQHSTEPQ